MDVDFTFESAEAVEKLLKSKKLDKILSDYCISISDENETYIEGDITEDVINSILADVGHPAYQIYAEQKKEAARRLKRDQKEFEKKLCDFVEANRKSLSDEVVHTVLKTYKK